MFVRRRNRTTNNQTRSTTIANSYTNNVVLEAQSFGLNEKDGHAHCFTKKNERKSRKKFGNVLILITTKRKRVPLDSRHFPCIFCVKRAQKSKQSKNTLFSFRFSMRSSNTTFFLFCHSHTNYYKLKQWKSSDQSAFILSVVGSLICCVISVHFCIHFRSHSHSDIGAS